MCQIPERRRCVRMDSVMNIPDFPLFKVLDKEDKPIFEDFLSKRPLKISDYTFTNFYIWRMADKTQLTMINGNLCALVIAPDKQQYFMMPLGNNKMEETLEVCLSFKPAVIRTDEEFVSSFVKDTEKFAIEEDRGNFDYVYRTTDLAELKGRRYDGKRNHINSFLRSNSFSYEKMDKTHVKECLELNEKWCLEKKRESEAFPNIECEGMVVKEVLENLEDLDAIGGIIRVDGKISAFSVGEMLNNDTAVIHIEKADPTIRGMSQLINREFVCNEWSSTTYINREQDMGHPGLRKAKSGYHPVRLEKKFNITMKK